jgi:hypothetical protein
VGFTNSHEKFTIYFWPKRKAPRILENKS